MDADLEKLSVKLGWSDPRYSAQKGHSLFQDVEQGCIGGGGGASGLSHLVVDPAESCRGLGVVVGAERARNTKC